MSHKTTKTIDGKKIIMNLEDDLFDVDFQEHILKFHSMSIASALVEILRAKDSSLSMETITKVSAEMAFKQSKANLESMEKIKVPEKIIDIINNDYKKKEQEKELKGLELTIEELCAVFLYASKNNYKYSSIKFEGTPKDYKDKDLPSFAYIDDEGNVHKDKETELTDAQIKALIKQSPVIYAQIFDNGTHWFCFLRTFRGLKGEESGPQGSKPHLHFLSDKNGGTKEELIKCIKNGNYPAAKIHIPLVG